MTRNTLRTLVVAAAVSAALAACVGGPAGGDGPAPLTPLSRFALQVEPGVDRIALAVREDGVSAAQEDALAALANRFGVEGATTLRVEAPAGGDVVANDFAFRVKAALEHVGAPGHLIQVVAYDAPDARAPVLVGFETIRAVVPQCGTAWGNLARTNRNETSANFGCAVTANLAAQIANPRDIVTPRGMTPSDAGRRAVVFDNYRKGSATAAQHEDLIANERVSQAVE
ncbi:CpaD family pilus assembly protein [soil metagenome]